MIMRTRERWLFACLTLIGGLIGGALSNGLWSIDAAASAAGRKVRSFQMVRTMEAEKFILIDPSGQQRGALQVLPSGLAALSLNDQKGQDRAELRVASDGSASIGFFDSQGNQVAMLGEGSDGHAGFRVYRGDGKEAASLASAPNG